jgi:cytidylate kinase
MIITIGRQFGSGGHEIGAKLAKTLNFDFFDKEIISETSKLSGFSRKFVESYDEKRTGSLLYSLVMGNNSYGQLPIGVQANLTQFDAMKKLAEGKNCIIVGRCADYVFRNAEDLVNIFIHAGMDWRTERVSKLYGITENKAREMIQKNDKSRKSYYNYYTDKMWGEAANYHIAIDSGAIGVEHAVKFIEKYVRLKAQI